MDQEWKDWLDESLARNCDLYEIRDILMNNNYSLASVRAAMGDKFPLDPVDSGLKRHYLMPADMYKALTEIRITKPAIPALHGPSPIQRIETDLLQLYVLENFITDEECDALSALARTKLQRSTVAGGPEVQYVRTSSTCDLHSHDHPLVKNIDQRIAGAMGIHLSYSQEIEAQLYRVGQQFRTHTDTFPPFTPMYQTYAGTRGNRTWTFMVYLTCATQGGGTEFTELNRVFNPKRGTALIWNNLYADGIPNDGTSHAGLPVLEGEKIVITKWFRERGEGLMFMDPIPN